MNTKATNYILLGLVAVAAIAGVWAYPYLPQQIASHWNTGGQADGYMGKFWGVLMFPLIMAGFALLYFVIPKLDPLKKNIMAFDKSYNAFWIFMSCFFLYIFGLSLAWNLGMIFNFTFAIVPATSLLFFAMGMMISKAKRNWFVGVRTPWTLSSDEVWDKTHKLGGKLFKISAVFPLIALFAKGNLIIFIAVVFPIVAISIFVIVYSYFVYKSLSKS